MNPVMMLDEIDKLGADFRGDPVGGAPRGARPGAELQLLRPLPRRALRPLEGDVHRHGEPARPDPRPAPRPHGDPRAPRLHLRGEGPHRAATTSSRSSSRSTGSRRTRSSFTEKALIKIIMAYTREAGVRNLERRIADVCRAVAVEVASGKVPPGAKRDRRRERPRRHPRAGEVLHRDRRAHRDPGRRDRPRLDRGRRRHPLHRGDPDARQGVAHPHRPARRRDEGVGAGGALATCARKADTLGIAAELPREDRHPHPLPGGRDPQGRPERRA